MKVSVIDKPPAHNRMRTAAFALLWRDKKVLLALVYLISLYTVALLAPLFIGDQISKIDFTNSLLAPSLANGGHILGTDTLGRDLFLRFCLLRAYRCSSPRPSSLVRARWGCFWGSSPGTTAAGLTKSSCASST